MAIGTLSISSRRQKGKKVKACSFNNRTDGRPACASSTYQRHSEVTVREQLELKYAITPTESNSIQLLNIIIDVAELYIKSSQMISLGVFVFCFMSETEVEALGNSEKIIIVSLRHL